MWGVGDGIGVSFRKRGCGIEGKWKGGKTGVNWGVGFTRFPHESAKGMWIYGSGGGKGGFGWDWRGVGGGRFCRRLGVSTVCTGFGGLVEKAVGSWGSIADGLESRKIQTDRWGCWIFGDKSLMFSRLEEKSVVAWNYWGNG
jgi:hypothetical protein